MHKGEKPPNDSYLNNNFKNSINKEIKLSKKEYYRNDFENCKTDMRKTWMGIRNIMNTKRSISIHSTQIIVNGKSIKNPKHVSNTFNKYWSKHGADNS